MDGRRLGVADGELDLGIPEQKVADEGLHRRLIEGRFVVRLRRGRLGGAGGGCLCKGNQQRTTGDQGQTQDPHVLHCTGLLTWHRNPVPNASALCFTERRKLTTRMQSLCRIIEKVKGAYLASCV